ncbi:unnamed protein product [Nippostrongylus brasiliensis]|uniref:Secreted protein n=1 Tax=Nippostrongylus brasiliensis TaxID=27835 RepID=A0A0N4XVY1_NIPBR|nr:hypothetical protein Q1695_010103 [Nippostrongylus brasiliensis]VDL70583.1 unnamed protein product [Nippostrongylus brasiliensis]
MKAIPTLMMAITIALLPREGYSQTFDRTQCNRSLATIITPAQYDGLSHDLKRLGFDADDTSILMTYSLSDDYYLGQIIHNINTSKFFLVYGSTAEDDEGDICGKNIAVHTYRDYFLSCEGPFVLNVNMSDCQVLNADVTFVGKETHIKEGLKKLGYQNISGETPAVIVLIQSNADVYSLNKVHRSSSQIFFVYSTYGGESDIPMLISQAEYEAYVSACTTEVEEYSDILSIGK